MSDADFDPDDIKEMMWRFKRLEADTKKGYLIDFYITRAGAREMIAIWLKAVMGDDKAIKECMENYSYIMEELMFALKNDDDAEDY